MSAGNPSYDALLSTTLGNYRKTFADNVSRSYWLGYWLTQDGKKKTQNGGESIYVQLMYGKNSTIKAYGEYDTLDTTPQEGMTMAKFPWRHVAGTVSISRIATRKNSGEAALINLLSAKVKQAEITMRDEMNRMFFADGTGMDSKELFGMSLLVEDGTAWGTVAGIDRSDSLNTFWRNQWIGSVGSFATNGVKNMRTLYNRCSRGNEHPDFGVSDQDTFEFYEASLVGNERFTDQEVGDAGFVNLKFKGMVLGYDEQCDAATMLMLNSNYIEWVVDSETDIINTPFESPVNQDTMTSKILVMGNLVVSNSARHGRMNGITA